MIFLPYKLRNPDPSFYRGEGREFNRRRRLCSKAYEAFEGLRGRVIAQTVMVERELARAICWYFFPGPQNDREITGRF